MSNWLIRKVGRFFGRNAYMHCPCVRCGGSGYIPQYSHVQGGVCFRCGGDGIDPSGALRPNQSLEYGEIHGRTETFETAAVAESIEHERHVDNVMREADKRSKEIDEEMSKLDPRDVEGHEMLQREAELADTDLQAELEAEEADYQAKMEALAWEADDEASAFDDWGDGGYDDDRY